MTRNKRTLSDIDCSGEAVSIEWSQRSCKRRYQRPITPTTEPLLRDSVSRRQEKTKHSLVRSWLDTVLANENLAEQLTGTSSGPISVTGNVANSRQATHRRTRSLSDTINVPFYYAPLSYQNLCKMDPSGHPMTPTMSAKSTQRQSESSPTKQSTWSHAETRLNGIGIRGERDGAAELERLPSFKEAVMGIVNQERSSAMKPESVKKYKATLETLDGANETTCMFRILPFLVKEIRAQDRPFFEDFLEYNIDTDFAPGSVPLPENVARGPENDRSFGIKNPRPDVTFGFGRKAFAEEEVALLGRFDPELSRRLLSPFLVIEWKAARGVLAEAKVQVRRNGAAMVNARRNARLQSQLSQDSSQPDMDTIAFSLVINDDLALFYVHWVQEDEGCLKWHMAIVKKFFVDEMEIANIRRTLHNIIDWNLESRMRALRTELEAYKAISARSEISNKRKRVL